MAPEGTAQVGSPTHTSSTQLNATSSTSRQSSTTASRRTSQIYSMGPPATYAPAMTPSHSSGGHSAFPPLSPSILNGAPPTSVDSAGIPIRHPKPLTAAELHLELEKEQEAVVNRLTRELSALRAHSASVASTASSAASGAPGTLLDSTDPAVAHAGSLTGPTHPTTSRRHRSSSSVSRSSVSAVMMNSNPSAPAPHRYSVSSQPGAATEGAARAGGVNLSTPRYEEVLHYRHELEDAKRENDTLRRRVRELEALLKGQRSTSSENAERGRTKQVDRSSSDAEKQK